MNLALRTLYKLSVNYNALSDNLTLIKNIVQGDASGNVLSTDPAATIIANIFDANGSFGADTLDELNIYLNDSSGAIPIIWSPNVNELNTFALSFSDPSGLIIDKTFKNIIVSYNDFLLTISTGLMQIDSLLTVVNAYLDVVKQRIDMERLIRNIAFN